MLGLKHFVDLEALNRWDASHISRYDVSLLYDGSTGKYGLVGKR